MADEDKRSAIGFSVTLSSQLMAAALAMLAVEGAYVSYALGSRNTSFLFIPLSAIAAVAFIVSIFVAGKAITKARDAGFSGGWSLAAGKSLFNWQAVLLLAALLLLAASFLASGRSKEAVLESNVEALRADIQRLDRQLRSVPLEHKKAKQQLELQIENLTVELRSFRRELAGERALSQSSPPRAEVKK